MPLIEYTATVHTAKPGTYQRSGQVNLGRFETAAEAVREVVRRRALGYVNGTVTRWLHNDDNDIWIAMNHWSFIAGAWRPATKTVDGGFERGTADTPVQNPF